MSKELIQNYREYLILMESNAKKNKNIDGKRNIQYYEGLERGFRYAIEKIDWIIPQFNREED